MKRRQHWSLLGALSMQPLLGALLFSVGACANFSGAGLSSSPTLAVLINRTWTEDDPRGFAWEVREEELETERHFAACVRAAAHSKGVPLRVMTGTEFRAAVFPDLDPRAAPRKIETLRSLIADARFRGRIEAAHIDYLAIVGGETRTSETQGGLGCFGGGPAGACFGLLWWDHRSHLSAMILDLRRGGELASEGVDAAGRSWFAIFVALPLAAPSFHEAEACDRMGDAVARALAGMPRGGD